MPPIRGFLENTLIDWEGRLAAEIFLPGCPFRCGYCHARHLVEPQPGDESIPLEAVLDNVREQNGWLDGIVISGGEPTLHDDLPELIGAFRDEGLAVKLDTNGSNPEALARLLRHGRLDCVAMDVKAPLDHRYSEVARVPVDLAAIRRSIDLLMHSDIEVEFRTTVCPGLVEEDEILAIARAIQGARSYFLQKFRPVNCLDRSMERLKSPNQDQMRAYCRIAAPYVERCVVRGDSASERVGTGAGIAG